MSSTGKKSRAVAVRGRGVTARTESSPGAASVVRHVLAAAHELIRAFSSHDRAAYFRAFSPDASFIFHTHAQVLTSRTEYEELWRAWEIDLGFKVMGCESSEQSVQLLGGAAVFRHRVSTTVATRYGMSKLDERETIVFQRMSGRKWMAVHEHLSPVHRDDARTFG